MRVDEKQLKVTGVEEQLKVTKSRKGAASKKAESVTIVDQYKERGLLVKALVGTGIFVIVVFTVIFAIQLLSGDQNVDKTLEVFKAISSMASPFVTLVLGYYFGIKNGRK
ncbi:hypothetical protein [Paenibacillus rubinfantis]|uniref:hypothetical protein n=1 Tax=Paenibacillus rubinfantis TaxID=1720296 RepID=UPI00073F0C65|nr:hypothetical protein [Paenibacillus rubinfantis]